MEIITLSGIAVGSLVSLVLLFFPQAGRSGNQFLGITVILLSYALLLSHLYYLRSITDFPHLSRTSQLFVYLITPSFYLFTRFLFYRQKYFLKWDWLILIPSLLYFIDYLPYFLLSEQEKVLSINRTQLGGHFDYNEGSFSFVFFHFYIRQFWSLLFLLLSVRIMWLNRAIIKFGNTKINKTIFWFIGTIIFFLSISLIPGFGLFFPDIVIYSLGLQTISVSITLILIAIFLMFHPNFLYGFFWENEIALTFNESAQNKPLNITVEADKIIFKKIEDYVSLSQSYKLKGYSIHDLSKETSIPVYKISSAINSCIHTNFNQWINHFRIELFEDMIKNNLQDNLTLHGLALNCGFSNSTTFISAFKKVKGTTPHKYLKENSHC